MYGQPRFEALVFSGTAGYRHESILEGVAAINLLGERHQFGVAWTEDANVFLEDDLSKFDVVVFLNTSDNMLTDEQQAAFQEFIQSGKGFVGIHGAAASEYDWEWYGKLIGRFFKVHPKIQTAVIDVIDKNHPATFHLPERWLWTDEWYDFEAPLTDDLNVVLTVDESTYNSEVKGKKPSNGMGDFHPIAWYHEFDGGRSFYTALGHSPLAYEDPLFMQHIYGAIFWAATGRGL